VNDNVSVYEMVENIVQVVYYTHYGYITDPELKKDLMQVGFLKAYELLNNGNYDPTMSLRNFLYTGIRNEMHNTLYHLGKIKTVSLDDGLGLYENVIGYRQIPEYSVEEKVVRDVCDKFSYHGDYYPIVFNYLLSLGIVSGSKLDVGEVDNDLTDGIIVLTLWSIYEREVENG
jgi:hypothetical protein